MQLQNFTTELLYSIFQNLSHADQIACSSVCQSWRTVVATLCYKNITFSDQYYHQVTSLISEGKDWLLGIYVQSLNTSMNCDPPTRKTFSEMLSQLPFLKKVTVSSRHFCTYMDYLEDLTGKIQLEEIVNNNQLDQLDQLDQMNYLNCVHQYRQSIKRLDIHIPGASRFSTPNALLDNPLQYLKDLTELKYLTVTSRKVTINLLNLLQHCPDLVHLTYRDRQPLFAEDNYILLTPHPHRFLERVTLKLHQLNLSHIKYILSYFPTCLNLFSITLDRIDPSAWLIEDGNSKTAMQSLGDYLGHSVKTVEVIILNNISLTKRLGVRPSTLYNTIATFMSFVKSIQGNRKLTYHLIINVTDSRERMNIKRDEHTMHIRFTLDMKTFFRHIEANPYWFLSPNSEQMLKSVQILISGYYKSNRSLVEIIRCLFSTYHSLDIVIFNIKSSNILVDGSVYTKSTKNDCNSSFFHDMINRGGTIAVTLFRGLDYLVFNYARLSSTGLKEITDLFSDISVLRLIPCRIIDSVHREVTLNFSKIEHLGLLVLNLERHLCNGDNLYGFNLRLENVCTKETILYYAEVFDSQRFTIKQVNALTENDPKQLYLGSTKIPIITVRYQNTNKFMIGVDEEEPILHVPLSSVCIDKLPKIN